MKKEFIFIISCLFSLLGCVGTHTTTSTQVISLQITPNQCEAPWQNNQGNSNEERLKAYLNENSVELLSYTQKSTDMMTCSACGCPGTMQFLITIPEKDKAALIKQGFIEVARK